MATTCPIGFSCKIIGGDSGKCKNILFPISTPSNELTPEVAKKILSLPNPTANWKTIIGTDAEEKPIYEIKIPLGWKEIEHSSNFYFVKEFQAEDKSYFSVVYQETPRDTLKEYLSDLDLLPNFKKLSEKDVNFLGEKAVERNEINNNTGFNQLATYIYLNKKVFIIKAYPATKVDIFETQTGRNYSQILSTFRFIDQNSSGRCVPKFKVESGPELTASQSYSQSCTEKTNKNDCLKVDVYNALGKNFGNPDGIPDCEWKI